MTIAPNGVLQADHATIIYKNFSGRPGMYNREGEMSFSLLIPDEEAKELLVNDLNEYGCGWNVKIKEPRDGYDTPFMHLPVKVKFNGRGPNIFLISGRSRRRLDESEISMLDKIDISRVDLDIAPSDGEVNGRPYRAAYLRSMEVTQELDRFSARYMDEDREEEDFNY